MQNLFEDDKPKKPAQKKLRARNEIWDALTDVFDMSDITKAARTRIGKVTEALRARRAESAGTDKEWGLPPDKEIFARKKRFHEMYPKAHCTIEALEKHWDDLGKKPVSTGITQDDCDRDWERAQIRRQEELEAACTTEEQRAIFKAWRERNKSKKGNP